ncbi:MAG: alkaline phosphatase D family protein, partial [Myxococcaceae bacterium]|nr:alkaline phosphatase D family protein [Myxococcaceae bacterium]
DRDRVLDVVDALPRRNTVVLTGDIHVGCFSRVQRAGAATHSAVEIVTNSISSGGSMGGGDGVLFEALIGAIPGWMYAYEGRRGYTACEVTHDGWRVDYRVVDSIDMPGGAKSTHASFEIRSDLATRRV